MIKLTKNCSILFQKNGLPPFDKIIDNFKFFYVNNSTYSSLDIQDHPN